MGLFRWLGSPRGEYERENHARRSEKMGDHEAAANYRACLSPREWRDMGWEGEFGSYRKARAGVSLSEATNGAYGGKRDLAPVESLKRDMKVLANELTKTKEHSLERRKLILEEYDKIKEEVNKLEALEMRASRRAAE